MAIKLSRELRQLQGQLNEKSLKASGKDDLLLTLLRVQKQLRGANLRAKSR